MIAPEPAPAPAADETDAAPPSRAEVQAWLEGAGVGGGTAAEASAVLSERGWRWDAGGSLEELRGIAPEAAVLARRRVGGDAVRAEAAARAGLPGGVKAAVLKRASLLAAERASQRELARYETPSRATAAAKRAAQLFEDGANSPFGSGNALGELGVGVELFFLALRVSFFAMFLGALCYAPALYLNRAGNDGYGMSANKIAAAGDMGLVRFSLGNQGLDRDALAQKRGRCSCDTAPRGVADCVERNGVDCRCASGGGVDDAPKCGAWRRLRVFGRSVRDRRVAIWLSASALGACAVFACAAALFDRRLTGVVAARRSSLHGAEPADYTVVVRGLPKDATISTIREHFSARYGLSGEGAYLSLGSDARAPVGGISAFGARFHASAAAAPLAALAARGIAIDRLPAGLGAAVVANDKARRAALVAAAALLGFALTFFALTCRRYGSPLPRPTPRETWEAERSAALRRTEARRRRARRWSRGKVAPGDAALDADDLDAAAKILCADEPSRAAPCATALHVGGNVNFVGSWVADVQCSHPFGPLIRSARKMLAADERTETAAALLRRAETASKPKKRRIARLAKKLARAEASFGKASRRLRRRYDPEKTMKPCCVAFVTFVHEESALRCLDDYRASRSWYWRLFQPKSLRYQGRARLNVKRAPAPSNVLWENLGLTKFAKLRRGAASALVTLLLLAASALAINKAAVAAREAVAATPDALQCEALAAVHYGTYNTTFGRRRFNGSAACADDEFSVGYADLDYGALPRLSLTSDGAATANRNSTFLAASTSNAAPPGALRCARPPGSNVKVCKARRRGDGDYGIAACGGDAATCGGGDVVACRHPGCALCDGRCAPAGRTRANEDQRCYTLPCYEAPGQVAPGWIDEPGMACFEYHPSMASACFCRFNLGFKKAAYVIAGRRDLSDEAEVCAATIRNYFLAFLLKLGVAFLVVVVNEFVRVGIYVLTNFERHGSHTTRLVSLVSKLTKAQVVNTALLALAINAALDREEAPDVVNAASKRTNLLDGTHRGMSKQWYASVGASLTVTMASNVVVPQISFVQKIVVKELKRRVFRSCGVKTQAALDALYRPPPWQIERSYAIVLTTLAVTCMYAPGLPILSVFATIALGVAYWVNKVLVLKFCHQPPNFDETLGRQFGNALYFIAALQFAMAAFILSEPELVHAGAIGRLVAFGEARGGLAKYAFRRMARRNVAPLWIGFLAYVGLLVLWHAFGRPFANLVARCCCCCGGGARDLSDVYRQPPFSEAWTCVSFGARERRKAAKKKRVAHDDGDLFLRDDCTLYRRWDDDADPAARGRVKLTWEVMAQQHLATYNVVRNPDYERVMSLLDKLGYRAYDDEEAITRPSAVRINVARVKKAAGKKADDARGDDPPTARVSAAQAAEEANALLNPTGRAAKGAWGGEDPAGEGVV